MGRERCDYRGSGLSFCFQSSWVRGYVGIFGAVQLLGSSGDPITFIENNQAYLSGTKSVVFTNAGDWIISNDAERFFETGVAKAEGQRRKSNAKINKNISRYNS